MKFKIFNRKPVLNPKKFICEFRVRGPVISAGKKFYPCVFWTEGFTYQSLVNPAEYFEDKAEAQRWRDEKNKKVKS